MPTEAEHVTWLLAKHSRMTRRQAERIAAEYHRVPATGAVRERDEPGREFSVHEAAERREQRHEVAARLERDR
jgi:hypothetical protein